MQSKDDTLFKCPKCGNETFPADMDVVKQVRQKQEAELYNPYRSCSLPEGVKVEGGADPTGTSGTERLRKKSTQKIFNQMFKET